MEQDALGQDIFSHFLWKRKQREATAARILAENLKRVRAKLGEVQTTLTYAIGAAEGVGRFSVKEIMYVYGVDRSTAYRWKKFGCHPWEKPQLDSLEKIRWTDQLKRESPARKPKYRAWNPRLDAITQARSSVRCALNKLREMDADPRYAVYPMDAACEKAADELKDAAEELESMVYYARHDEYDDDVED